MALNHSHFGHGFTPARDRDAESWVSLDEDDQYTPIDAGEQVLISPPPPLSPLQPNPPTNSGISRRSTSKTALRQPSFRIKRLKSRQRQKAQNAQAGIKLITDMSTLRRQHKEGHIVHHMRPSDNKPVKFVDTTALRALEGEPSSASVGNWSWLRKNKDNPEHSPISIQETRKASDPLSPEERPIPIGIALPSGEIVTVSPQTAHIDDISTNQDPLPHSNLRLATPSQSDGRHQTKSVWSPDTPETATTFSSSYRASSIYSQVTAHPSIAPSLQKDVPPVPALPANYKKSHHHKLISLEISDNHTPVEEEHHSPCTLFEEDGTLSPLRHAKSHRSIPQSALTPDSALSRSRGWWDHVITPFTDRRLTFASRSQHLPSPQDRKRQDTWGALSQTEHHRQVESPTTPLLAEAPDDRAHSPPLPTMDSQSRAEVESFRDQSPSPRHSQEQQEPYHNEKSEAFVVTEDQPQHEQLPAYSPPKRNQADPVRFRAVFPPGHPLQAQFPPTPVASPGTPGLAHTMTSQGATEMTEIPLTPAGHGPVSRDQPLPVRPVGTSLPREHNHEARGDRHRVERRRRRHEKEERAARKAGGFWRGRGCVPESGCFGRTGREGRKKRRCCCFFCCLFIGLLILAIVLSVVLTRPRHHEQEHSIWVNLTDYPPMPTGVLTFVGPDNTVSRSICTEPNTLWSCSLPKDDQASNEPYHPDQPTIIFQIQWDNSTRKSWDVPNPGSPDPISKRNGGAAYAGSVIRAASSSVDGFTSNPLPPQYDEAWFLGETTDGIKADNKAGEATPFFISLLSSLNDTIDSPNLSKRANGDNNNGGSSDDGNSTFGNTPLSDLIPRPNLLSDGTPAPAVMLPTPVQQPVRLFDRGLPTEHYGFYTYFSRTIYLKSVTVLNDTNEGNGDVPLDENGGCSKTEADYLTTWSQTRLLVQIWTRSLNESKASILKAGDSSGTGGPPQLIKPGTMPYPVTVTLDTHGGDAKDKFVWEWPMNDRQQLDLNNAKLLSNNIGAGGKLINPRGSGDAKYGGFDGGDGGCKCEWVNWVG